MLKKINVLLILCSLWCVRSLQAQIAQEDIVQFSGVVTFEDNGEIFPLVGATVSVKGTNRGTSSAIDGLFSLVAVKGETIQIRFIGFRTEEITIPEDADTYYSVVQNLLRESIDLPLVEILPIPSKEFFKIEFLAMEVNDPYAERARENLASGLMQEILEILPVDGTEVARSTMRQTAQSYYYAGQFRPQNILSPLAWKKFIDSWRNGDFKKKKKKK
mgnify:CR=1 FL=1